MTVIGCLYISDFPAWARQTQHSSWRAIAVYRQGHIVARTRLLKQRSLQVGESLGRARTLFPEARFFEQDRLFEQAVWEGVVQQVNEITPFLASLEHGWLVFRPYKLDDVRKLANSLTASVGLGPNRSTARFAALRSAPGSVLQVKQHAIDQFLASTSVNVLIGLGFEDDLVQRLRLFGLTSLASLRRLSQRHLRAQFGTVGDTLFRLLHPDKRSQRVPLYSPPATITETFDMDGALLEWLPLNHLTEQLARRVMRRLGNNCLCRTVTLQLRLTAGSVLTKQRILKKPTASTKEVVRAASTILDLLVKEASEGTELSLTVGGLRNPQHRQASLFFERPPLSGAVSNLEERFPGSLKQAKVINPDAPFPEDAVRYSPFTPDQYCNEAMQNTG